MNEAIFLATTKIVKNSKKINQQKYDKFLH